jgi:hypothetical protein
MRTRAVFLTLGVLAAMTCIPHGASGKGAWRATLSGPGLDAPVVIGSKAGRDVNRAANLSGLYSALFEAKPNALLDEQPDDSPGPRFEIAYDFDGPGHGGNVVRQDVYPYASPPITYVEPGQPVFDDEATTLGGWYEARPRLLRFLLAEGLPDLKTAASAVMEKLGRDKEAAALVQQSRPVASQRGNSWVVLTLLGAALLVGTAAFVVVARRRRLRAAHA